MDEYAVTFYGLLNQSLKLDAEEFLQQLMVSGYPHMEESDRKDILDKLQNARRDFLADNADREDYSGIEQLKGLL